MTTWTGPTPRRTTRTARSVPTSSYFGIRRFPYSVDFTRNALTFGHIQNAAVLPPVPIGGGGPNSEVHNAGEVWSSMLFEAYVELQKNPNLRTFAEVRRAFADYLVLGLQLTPINATFTETRDGILAAAQMLNPDDVAPIAAAFARRGAGSCAVSPPRDAAADLAPVTESFEVQPAIALTSAVLDDSVNSCDQDGILDAGETGQVTVEVSNTSPSALVGSTVTLSSPTAGVVFPDGPSATLPDVGPFGTGSVTIAIGLDDTVTDIGLLELTTTVDNAGACVASVSQVQTVRIHADEVPESSATEDVEAVNPPWSKTGIGADTVWTRAEIDPSNHAWHGADSGAVTDTQLTTPPLLVSATGDFTMSFAHSHSFEADTILWDGGVIEISTDEGATWADISTIVDPGYTGTITDTSGNPLGRAPGLRGRQRVVPGLRHRVAQPGYGAGRPDRAGALPHRHRRGGRRAGLDHRQHRVHWHRQHAVHHRGAARGDVPGAAGRRTPARTARFAVGATSSSTPRAAATRTAMR